MQSTSEKNSTSISAFISPISHNLGKTVHDVPYFTIEIKADPLELASGSLEYIGTCF